ncbi:hypothetical protein YC2023_067846 [Brassica napus]
MGLFILRPLSINCTTPINSHELKPEHCWGYYVLMSNVYVDAEKYEQVLDVRDMMKQRNVKKKPGYISHTIVSGLERIQEPTTT